MPQEQEVMPKPYVVLFGLYVVFLNVTLVYALMRIWPQSLPAQDDHVALLWGNRWVIQLAMETRFLMIVVLAGALGSYIHLATSFADFLGNRRLLLSWGWWYVLRPFIGVALALILYFVMRAGLVTGTSDAKTLNVYGIAAIAGMTGMFAKQATDKLREVFENLFRTQIPPDRADKLDDKNPPGLEQERSARLQI